MGPIESEQASHDTLVFVYGTLMRGQRSFDLLAGAVFIAEDVTQPGFRLVSAGWYPAMLHGGDGTVRGEIYRVDTAALERLDRYEQVPQMYTREELVLASGRVVEAYVGVTSCFAQMPGVPSGDWRAWGAES